MNRWVDGLTNEQYHNDKENVSSSGLKLLINESADVFEYQIVKGNQRTQTDAMRLGTLVHHAVLEGEDFIKRYVVMPKYDLRKNADKIEKERWVKENKDKVIVTEDDIRVLEGTYESIFKHADAGLILKNCIFERSGYFTDPFTGVACRIRYDAFDRSTSILADIKAVRSVERNAFSYALKDYRWDLSMAMYGQGILEIDQAPVDNYMFIAVEKTAPYRCAVYELGERSLEAGRQDYFKALSILKDCRANSFYPPIQSRYETLDLPTRFLEEKNV